MNGNDTVPECWQLSENVFRMKLKAPALSGGALHRQKARTRQRPAAQRTKKLMAVPRCFQWAAALALQKNAPHPYEYGAAFDGLELEL